MPPVRHITEDDLHPYERMSASTVFGYVTYVDTLLVYARVNGDLVKSTDGGRMWKHILRTRKVRSMDVIGAGDIAVVSDSGLFVRSTDDGKTWRESRISRGENTSVRFASGITGFVSVYARNDDHSEYKVFRTTDGGSTWKDVVTTVNKPHHVAFAGSNMVWSIGIDGIFGDNFNDAFVVYSDDGGSRWYTPMQTIHGPGTAIAMNADCRIGFLGTWLELRRSVNGGNTWDYPAVPFGFPVDAIVIRGDSTVIVAARTRTPFDGSISRSTDLGEHWTTEWEGDGIVTSLSFLNDSTGWAGVTTGGIMRYRQGTWSKIPN